MLCIMQMMIYEDVIKTLSIDVSPVYGDGLCQPRAILSSARSDLALTLTLPQYLRELRMFLLDPSNKEKLQSFVPNSLWNFPDYDTCAVEHTPVEALDNTPMVPMIEKCGWGRSLFSQAAAVMLNIDIYIVGFSSSQKGKAATITKYSREPKIYEEDGKQRWSALAALTLDEARKGINDRSVPSIVIIHDEASSHYSAGSVQARNNIIHNPMNIMMKASRDHGSCSLRKPVDNRGGYDNVRKGKESKKNAKKTIADSKNFFAPKAPKVTSVSSGVEAVLSSNSSQVSLNAPMMHTLATETAAAALPYPREWHAALRNEDVCDDRFVDDDDDEDEKEEDSEDEGCTSRKSSWYDLDSPVNRDLRIFEEKFKREGTDVSERVNKGQIIFDPSDPTMELRRLLLRGLPPSPDSFYSPRKLVWDPERQFLEKIQCPLCKSSTNVARKGYPNRPRRIYSMDDNVYLFTRQYTCKRCKNEKGGSIIFQATDPRVVQQLPFEVRDTFPAYLTKRSGVTTDVLRLILPCIDPGGMGPGPFSHMMTELITSRVQSFVNRYHSCLLTWKKMNPAPLLGFRITGKPCNNTSFYFLVTYMKTYVV
jgi:hypothetical protein